MTRRVCRAVIPVAGRGSRLRPLTHVLPKVLFPVVLGGVRVKAVLQILLEQVRDAGVDEVILVVSTGQRPSIEAYLEGIFLSEGQPLARRLVYVEQDRPRGFGDAVLQTRPFVVGEPFAVLLGDHIAVPEAGAAPCLAQVLDAFEQRGPKAMIGVQEVAAERVSEVGVVAGQPVAAGVYRCLDFIEKPTPAVAREHLVTEGLPAGRFLGHCGVYVFAADIFTFLERAGRAAEEHGGEVELAAAQRALLDAHPDEYLLCRIRGKAYDMGTPRGYWRTLLALGGEELLQPC